ncbi:MAG: hypothetical protein QM749_03375 [Aquabacterium sp.]
MIQRHPLSLSAWAMTMLALFALVAGCSKSGGQVASASLPASATQAATVSKLGDLKPFRDIAMDVTAMVRQGNLAQAKSRIKDLEVAWDNAEAGLKPRAADDWHKLDKAIDQALEALRADVPVPSQCQASMAALLKVFDGLQGKT